MGSDVSQERDAVDVQPRAQGLPWGGTNLCLGVEPITSAFDFGHGVSAGDNPLAKAGYSTAVDFEAGRIG